MSTHPKQEYTIKCFQFLANAPTHPRAPGPQSNRGKGKGKQSNSYHQFPHRLQNFKSYLRVISLMHN